MMAAADYRLLTEATGQRIAAALEALSGTGAAAAAARTNLDVYSKGETDNAIAQSTANLIKFDSYTFDNIAFEAGAIGTRGAQFSADYNGGAIIGIYINYIYASATIIPIAFSSSSKIYLNIYRATNSAVTNNSVSVRVAHL